MNLICHFIYSVKFKFFIKKRVTILERARTLFYSIRNNKRSYFVNKNFRRDRLTFDFNCHTFSPSLILIRLLNIVLNKKCIKKYIISFNFKLKLTIIASRIRRYIKKNQKKFVTSIKTKYFCKLLRHLYI
jgi:hypothetical protein